MSPWSSEPGSTLGERRCVRERRIEAIRLKVENQATRRPLIYGVIVDGDGTVLALVGHDLDESDARGIVYADMDELPADAQMAVDCARISPVMRCPTEPIRPSFLMSRWISSPGCSRS